MRLYLLVMAYLAILVLARHYLASTPGSLSDRVRMVARGLASDRGDLTLNENKISSAEVRNQLLEAADRLRELRATPEDKRADTFGQDLRTATNEVLDLNGEFEARRAIEQYDLGLAAMITPPAPESRGPEAAFMDLHGNEVRTAGSVFTADPEYVEFAQRNESRSKPHEMEVRTLLDSGTTTFTQTDAGMWRPVAQPLPPQVRQQRLFIRDVLNVIPTGMSSVPYIRELNPTTTDQGATAIGEGVTKPEVEADFEQDVAIIKKIAAWIPATEEIIEDAPTLRGYIDTRLGYMLALREEAQVLNGSGNGPNIKGIRQYADLQTQAVVAGDFPATIGRSIAKIELHDGDADFVACNPSDFWVAVTTRHATQFDNGYGGGAPAALTQITWGLVPIRTRSMESGKALVGSRMGASILDRQKTVIRVGNQHSDFFVTNKVAILAEERVGLANHRPDLFVEATVPTS